MSQPQEPDESCPSKRSWREVLSGGDKIFVFNFLKGAGEEGGRSLGRVVLYIILFFIAVSLIGTFTSALFGWFDGFFTGWFDWLPFIGAETPEPTPIPAEETTNGPGFICSRTASFNPFCD